MLFGLFSIEWAWYNTSRIHNVDEERESCFPAFRRLEAKHWRKWRHYPLALTTYPMQCWFKIIIAPGTAAVSRLLTIGYKERPFKGWRKWLIDVQFKGMNILVLVVTKTIVSLEEIDDFDYSEWLGPGYKEKQVLPAQIATHVGAPHSCWLDTTVTLVFENHTFCVKKEGENVPVLSGILHGNQSFFIDRTSGDVAVQQIRERQDAGEKDTCNPPIMIYPEGSQGNGNYMLPFKRGAFESLKPV